MHHFGHNAGLQGASSELTMDTTMRPASAGSSSSEVPENNMNKAIWGTSTTLTPSLEPIHEGSGSIPPRRNIWLTSFPYSPAAFVTNTKTWNTFPEIRQATDLSSLPAPLGLERPITAPQGARVPVDLPIGFKSSSNMKAQVLRQQMPYTADVNLAYDFGETSPELVDFSGYIPNADFVPYCSNEHGSGFINMPNLSMEVNPPSACANPPFWQGNPTAEGGETNTSDVPACNELNITVSSLRIRGVRSPPQTYVGDIGRLCNRLIDEGADIVAVMFLRYIIFAKGVNVDALLAPLQPSEAIWGYDWASRMWEVLLEMREVIPGETTYCCLLCPGRGRREYKYGHDALRHFNRDHFGFSFPCEYW